MLLLRSQNIVELEIYEICKICLDMYIYAMHEICQNMQFILNMLMYEGICKWKICKYKQTYAIQNMHEICRYME